ncbi:MAG: ComEC/Rec2 family competence protein, partial [Treponema sp.]|nr:ComEC/Rec2 family competence protein [Treponema sp.]
PLSASAGAQIVTAPVALKMFGFFTPWGIISTVVVSPLISMFFILSLAAIALCLLLPFLAPVFNYIMNAAYNLIAVTVQLFALLPAIEL